MFLIAELVSYYSEGGLQVETFLEAHKQYEWRTTAPPISVHPI